MGENFPRGRESWAASNGPARGKCFNSHCEVWAMTTETIETAIDRYVQERMEHGRNTAREKFLAYAYLKHGRVEGIEFMKKAVGLCRYSINFLTAMGNPFRGPELFWLASTILVGIYSCFLMSDVQSRNFGILVFSAALVLAGTLVSSMTRKWSYSGKMIAIYREILEIAEEEMAQAV